MTVTVQIVLQADDAADTPTVVRNVFALDRDALTRDTVGLQPGPRPAHHGPTHRGHPPDQCGDHRPAAVPALRAGAAAQGSAHHRAAHPVRRPAPAQPS